MKALGEALKAHVRRDECNDPVIAGREGNIHADGTGYSVAVMKSNSHAWFHAKKRLAGFCQLRQDGDWEGVLHMARVPTPDQAEVLRELLCIRKIPDYSPEVLEAKREAMQKARESLTKHAQ